MYLKEFYHTKKEAEDAAVRAAGKFGFVNDGQRTEAAGFDYIAREAINDERSGDVPAFIAYDVSGQIAGVFAFPE